MIALLFACRPPGVEVVAAVDRGPVPTTPAIQGRDGGYSARIGDLSVWAHGDTILASEGASGGWLHSSVSWDGREWSDDPTEAKPLFDAHDILTVHYSPFGDVWLAVYSEPLGTGVFARTAPAPTGPWSSAVHLFDAELSDDGAVPYSAVAHAEYARPTADGWIELITYHRGTEPWHSELRQVEVELRSP